MLPTFSCLGWIFPCWVSPSGRICWESFNKNTWTIPGNERRGKYYILLMFIKVCCKRLVRKSLHLRVLEQGFELLGRWKGEERKKWARRGFFLRNRLLPNVVNHLQGSTQKKNKIACQNRISEWQGTERLFSPFRCTYVVCCTWRERERERENYEVQTQSSAIGNTAMRFGGQGYGAGNKAWEEQRETCSAKR